MTQVMSEPDLYGQTVDVDVREFLNGTAHVYKSGQHKIVALVHPFSNGIEVALHDHDEHGPELEFKTGLNVEDATAYIMHLIQKCSSDTQ